MSTETAHKASRASAQRKARRREDPRRNFILGVIFVALVALFFYFSLTKELPFMSKGGRLVTAYFAEPNQIDPGNTPVRVDGVQVGVVNSVTAEDGGRYGKVVLRLTNSDFPLHTDATAALQFRTLLGANFVVNLDPGSSSAPMLGANAIPLAHTTDQVGFDDILSVFRHNTGLATRTDLRQLSNSMEGSQLGSLIDDLAPNLTTTPAAFDDLRGEDQNDLSTLVASASDTVKTLAVDRSNLATLISGGSAAVGAIAGERPALAAALNTAPGALAETVDVSHSVEQTLPPLNRLLVALGPGAKELSPAAEVTRPTVIKLRSTLDRTQPLLSELKPAISQLSAASTPGDAVLTSFGTTLSRLNSNILPWLDSDDSALQRPIYQLIGPTFAGLGSVAAEYDSVSHVIHFPAQPEANSVDAVPCTIDGTNVTESQCASLNTLVGNLFGMLGSSSAGSSVTSAASSVPAARTKQSRRRR